MAIDQVTANLGLQLPHPDNNLEGDIVRLRNALYSVDAAVHALAVKFPVSGSLATTADVAAAIANLVATSPAALDTLYELAQALGNDPNFAATMTNALAAKAPSLNPVLSGGSHVGLTSLGVRSTGGGAFDLVLANAETLTASRTLTFKVNNAARLVDLAGNLVLAGSMTTAGAFASTFTMTGVTAVTFPTSGTLATLDGAETLTNKRVAKRVVVITPSAAPVPNGDAADLAPITGLNTSATLAAPTGSPKDGQPLVVRIKDDGTARALAFNTIYRASPDQPFPSATVPGKVLYLGFMYHAADAKWDLVALQGNY